ncbi:MAG: hypothetical protein M1816_001112 [Peltula sp. TS41687]|nr:MAG: hypothetical protein M1816_001112 [Peltula sp. TS41687]
MATPAPSDSRESSPLSLLASQSPTMSAYLPSPSSQAFSDVCPPGLELGSSAPQQTSNTNTKTIARPKKRKAQPNGEIGTFSQKDQLDGSPTKKKRKVTAKKPKPLTSALDDAAGSIQAESEKAKSGHELDASVGTVGVDGQPPATKSRKVTPKVRRTEYLDLPSSDGLDACSEDQRSQLNHLLKVIRTKKKIVVIAGAGISVSAGIPDFRSSNGLFSTSRSQQNPVKASGKHLFDASVYKTDAATSSFHDMVRTLAHLVESSKPTAFHHLLATLAQEGRLLRLYSQNVDGLEICLPPLATTVPLNAKGPWPRTIQLHGGLGKMVCQKCGHLSNFQPALFEGPEPPSCQECETLDTVRTNIAGKRSHGVGKLRPRIVLYNEYNPDEDAIGAVAKVDLRSRPDAVIVVGTSLKVRGVRRIVREMCGVVRGRKDGYAVWINNGPKPMGKEFEDCWDLIVRGDSDSVARLANTRRWDDPEPVVDGEEVGDDEWVKMKARESPQVVVDTIAVKTAKKNELDEVAPGILTPVCTPNSKRFPAIKLTLKKEQGDSKVKLTTKPSGVRKRKTASDGSAPTKKRAPKSSRKKSTNKKTAVQETTVKINSVFKATKATGSKMTSKASKSKAEDLLVKEAITKNVSTTTVIGGETDQVD